MKRNIFLILIATLFILVLIYFYDKTEMIINKEYIKDNIHIEYPFFNNQTIDGYIHNYLSSKIEEYDGDNIFIDYDYEFEDNIVDMEFYVYSENDNAIGSSVKRLFIDINSLDIKSVRASEEVSYEYYAYSNRVIDSDKPMIALTFDDGPNYNTSKILDILDKYNVKATFFVLGCNVKGNETVLKRMYKMGMEIGNHTYSHKLLSRLSKDKIEEEIEKTDELIFEVVGKYPTLLRPSYGTINKKIKSVAERPLIIWDIDTLDWKYHNSTRISNNILKKVKDGDIVLMHDIYSATANSLDIVIPKLLEQGYQLVTVTELFYYKGIGLESGKAYGYAR